MVKKHFFITLVIIFCTSLCVASDFRDTQWGMSKEQVLSIEKTRPIYSNNESLTYRGKLANIQVHIIYKFLDDKLNAGIYQFVQNYSNNNVYLKDYKNINNLLDLKYGNPDTVNEVWNNELYKEKLGYHGNAVSLGHLVLESKWTNDTTIIIHNLSGNNNLITHSVNYFDKKMKVYDDKDVDKVEVKGL